VIFDDGEKKNSIPPRPMCASIRDERVIEAFTGIKRLLASSSGQTWTVTLRGSLRSHIMVTEHVSLTNRS
jgi:hypothetical protein